MVVSIKFGLTKENVLPPGLESAWTTTPYAVTCGLENTRGKSKIDLYTYAHHQPVILSNRREGKCDFGSLDASRLPKSHFPSLLLLDNKNKQKQQQKSNIVTLHHMLEGDYVLFFVVKVASAGVHSYMY